MKFRPEYRFSSKLIAFLVLCTSPAMAYANRLTEDNNIYVMGGAILFLPLVLMAAIVLKKGGIKLCAFFLMVQPLIYWLATMLYYPMKILINTLGNANMPILRFLIQGLFIYFIDIVANIIVMRYLLKIKTTNSYEKQN